MVFTAKIGKVFLQSILNLNLNHSQTNRFNKFRAQSLYRTMKIEAEKAIQEKKNQSTKNQVDRLYSLPNEDHN